MRGKKKSKTGEISVIYVLVYTMVFPTLLGEVGESQGFSPTLH